MMMMMMMIWVVTPCGFVDSYGVTTRKIIIDIFTALRASDLNNIVCYVYFSRAVQWLKRLVTGLSPRRPGFAPGSIHVGFVVDTVALRHVFLRVLRFSRTNIIPPLLHIHLSPPHEVCDNSDQAAH
jgi:hypothetical protein